MTINISQTWIDYVAIIIAALAFLQPWIIELVKFIRRKYFISSVLKCYLGKSVRITFDALGTDARATLSLISKNCDNVITKIEAIIYKGKSKDSKIYSMEWISLETNYKRVLRTSGVPGSTIDRTIIDVSPIYLVKDVPLSYSIVFTDTEFSKVIGKIMDENNDVKNKLLTNLNYTANIHGFEIVLTDIKGKITKHSYTFNLTEEDMIGFRKNTEIISDAESKEDLYVVYVEITEE